LNVVSDEALLHKQLLDNRVTTAGFHLQGSVLADCWWAVTSCCGHFGQAAQGVESGYYAGSFADGFGLLADLFAQLAKQFVFPLSCSGFHLKTLPFASLEIRRNEALYIG